jgi:hypothetical protein
MNITVTKVLRELDKNYGWENIETNWFVKEFIKDILKVVDTELIKHKNISIKK